MQRPYPTTESDFYVLGYSARTSDALEADPATARIPGLWRRFHTEGLEDRIPKLRAKGKPFAVYFDYAGGAAGGYSVLVGYQVPGLDDAPAGLSGLHVRGGRYLMFTAEGSPAQAVPRAWAEIREYFARPGAPARAYAYDYEVHEDLERVSIFVGVR
ncbi:Integron-associated effector binding protein [Calidithermus terrae]|uniref:Integron-associated effector binding protein n=1 Tax=Calidithermus terrae TaxID=1408545 RepID=A0A399EE32_9DEIN|nr:GyrI-like domain-containing protein [Calidithermus terrae]RIH82887.1 Integron-associated effector binding protein [Calidithermus terrae]